eukprot:441745-Pleurochrysis_carterae.AAC.1
MSAASTASASSRTSPAASSASMNSPTTSSMRALPTARPAAASREGWRLAPGLCPGGSQCSGHPRIWPPMRLPCTAARSRAKPLPPLRPAAAAAAPLGSAPPSPQVGTPRRRPSPASPLSMTTCRRARA